MPYISDVERDYPLVMKALLKGVIRRLATVNGMSISDFVARLSQDQPLSDWLQCGDVSMARRIQLMDFLNANFYISVEANSTESDTSSDDTDDDSGSSDDTDDDSGSSDDTDDDKIYWNDPNIDYEARLIYAERSYGFHLLRDIIDDARYEFSHDTVYNTLGNWSSYYILCAYSELRGNVEEGTTFFDDEENIRT
jgi:hypothetical protein